MTQWFETAVSYEKVMENGLVKTVTEKYLFDALTFGESEEKTIRELTPYISGEFIIKANRRTKIAEIFGMDDADRYYLVKAAFITLNENTGEEKRTITQYLVGADNFEDALGVFKAGMNGTLADYEIAGISESPIIKVFNHFEKS